MKVPTLERNGATSNGIELLNKTEDAYFLRQMIGFAAQRIMDLEGLCATGYCERSNDLTKSCNVSYFPEFPEPRWGTEKALVAVMQEVYIKVVSTRSVDDLVKSLGMTGILKS